MAAVAIVLAGEWLYPPGGWDVSSAIVFTATVVSFSAVGAFLVVRVAENPIGWLLLGGGLMLALGVFAGGYSIAGYAAADGMWAGTALAAWMANVLFIPPIVVVAVGVPAIFPDGQLPSRRWRWLPVMLVVGTAAAVAVPAFTPGMMSGTVALDNPFGIPAFASVSDIVNMVSIITAPIVFVGATAAVIVRYRRGSSVVRHQVKWLAAVAAVSALAFPLAFALPVMFALLADSIVVTAIWLVGFSSLAALPVAIGVAVARYRLYEIDRLISRTIGWAILTAVLAGVLVGGIVILQAILAPFANENSIAVCASTLVALTLFQPLRHRVQRIVDRRFDRARYDGQRTADAFAHRLRSETDMTAVLGDLSSTTGASVAPSALGVWIRTAERVR